MYEMHFVSVAVAVAMVFPDVPLIHCNAELCVFHGLEATSLISP